MDNIEDYNFHVFWDRKRIGIILSAYAVVQFAAGVLLTRAIFDSSIPGAMPKDAVVPHPNSPSYMR